MSFYLVGPVYLIIIFGFTIPQEFGNSYLKRASCAISYL